MDIIKYIRSFGVDPDQQFCLSSHPNDKFYFSSISGDLRQAGSSASFASLISDIVSGKITIEFCPFHPTYGQTYHYITECGSADIYVAVKTWYNDPKDIFNMKSNNIYETETSALSIVEKITAEAQKCKRHL